MANFWYTVATKQIADKLIDWVNDDIRLMLCDNTTSVDTEKDVTLINGFTTLGELSGTGYARKVLASKAANKDDTNDRTELDAGDVLFTGINAGTAANALIFKHVTDDTDSIPLFYIDQADFPIVTNGGNVTLVVNVEGMGQIQA